MKVIEQKVQSCRKCGKKTVHIRSNTKSGGLAILVHIALIVVTAGVWLVLLIAWLILTAKIGGWTCQECGK